MYEFSTDTRQTQYTIFVDQGMVTAIFESDDTKGLKHERDEEQTRDLFLQVAKILVAEKPQEFKQMQDLLKDSDYDFWLLTEIVIFETIRELKGLLDWATQRGQLEQLVFNCPSFYIWN